MNNKQKEEHDILPASWWRDLESATSWMLLPMLLYGCH